MIRKIAAGAAAEITESAGVDETVLIRTFPRYGLSEVSIAA